MPMQMKKAFASDILGKAEYTIIIMITEKPKNAMSVEAFIKLFGICVEFVVVKP